MANVGNCNQIGTVSTNNDSQKPYFTREEVSKHNKKGDCWIILNGYVYNVTKFLNIHPGGSRIISIYAGQDATVIV